MKTNKTKPPKKDEAVEQFKSDCRRAGLRITPQRVGIYKYLLGTKEHPSAMTVYENVRKDFPDVSLDTVNRTLNTMAELGLAMVIPGSGLAKRFDADTTSHSHLRCVECRKIVDFNWPAFENIKLPGTIRKEFTILSKTLLLEGICKKCRSKKR